MSVYLFVTKSSRFAVLVQPKLAEDDQAVTYQEEPGVEQARIRGLLEKANRLIASAELTPDALKAYFQKIANLANGGSHQLRATLTSETNALWKKACVAGIQLTQAALKQALDSSPPQVDSKLVQQAMQWAELADDFGLSVTEEQKALIVDCKLESLVSEIPAQPDLEAELGLSLKEIHDWVEAVGYTLTSKQMEALSSLVIKAIQPHLNAIADIAGGPEFGDQLEEIDRLIAEVKQLFSNLDPEDIKDAAHDLQIVYRAALERGAQALNNQIIDSEKGVRKLFLRPLDPDDKDRLPEQARALKEYRELLTRRDRLGNTFNALLQTGPDEFLTDFASLSFVEWFGKIVQIPAIGSFSDDAKQVAESPRGGLPEVPQMVLKRIGASVLPVLRRMILDREESWNIPNSP